MPPSLGVAARGIGVVSCLACGAFHLEYAAGKRGAAAHTLYYAVERLPDGSTRVVILRPIHERMEPKLHIARTSVFRSSPKPNDPFKLK